MLKLPKGLKKKKKSKKAKRKGEEELFTEEELERYRKQHQHAKEGEGSTKENEEWSKFKNLTSGVDDILKKTQGDLDRIKSTSFFQRVKTEVREVESKSKEENLRPVVEITEADFPCFNQIAAEAEEEERSEYGLTDEESEEEEQDDIFDTSYVEAVERGEVKLAYIPDSPDEQVDDDIFDTSHVDALIKGQDSKHSKGNKGIDIGIAVEVLTGRIDNLTVTTSKRSKRVLPGSLLENTEKVYNKSVKDIDFECTEKSILDTDTDIPITTPIDLSVSLHSQLQQYKSQEHKQTSSKVIPDQLSDCENGEIDEFTLLAEKSAEISSEAIKLEDKQIKIEPIVQESWSVFEADKNQSVFAECIVEDQIETSDAYLDQYDPFDTSFAETVIPSNHFNQLREEIVSFEDDDFDPRAEEVKLRLNNRRKSSIRIHLTDPTGVRESITSDDIVEKQNQDLLGGSSTDLTQLGDTPLNPIDIDQTEFDPFDTTIVDKIVAPGRVELKFLEQELIGESQNFIYRVPSDPDFDPRAEETSVTERRASRPENLIVCKNVVFSVNGSETVDLEEKNKSFKPLTPYYSRDISITEDTNEGSETSDKSHVNSDEVVIEKVKGNREYSEVFQVQSEIHFSNIHILESSESDINTKVLTPSEPPVSHHIEEFVQDPFDTSFASSITPSKIELKLLTKEFSCEESQQSDLTEKTDLLDPSDDIFQIKALTPEPSVINRLPREDLDPFDTSFANELNPGRTEIRLLESEFLY